MPSPFIGLAADQRSYGRAFAKSLRSLVNRHLRIPCPKVGAYGAHCRVRAGRQPHCIPMVDQRAAHHRLSGAERLLPQQSTEEVPPPRMKLNLNGSSWYGTCWVAAGGSLRSPATSPPRNEMSDSSSSFLTLSCNGAYDIYVGGRNVRWTAKELSTR